MNLKSLYKFGLPMHGSFVDQNAFFLVPRQPTLPPSTGGGGAGGAGTVVSASAATSTVGGYKLCYILDKTVDQYGNVDVFYNNGNPIPIFPGATTNINNGSPAFITDAGGNVAISSAIVNISYNGDSNPPTGDPNTDTLVNVLVTMTSPVVVTFPAFSYTIKAQRDQQNNLALSGNPATKVYDGLALDFLQFVTTNSNAPINISYTGIFGTIYGPSSSAPIDAGNYSVTVSQSANSVYVSASAVVAFQILQISQIGQFAFTTNQAYYNNGNPVPLACTTTPVGLNYTVFYNGSTTAPSNIGSYVVQAQISDPNVSSSANGAIITGIYNIVRSNQIPSSAPNSTTIVRATYSAAIDKFLVDFVGTYQ